MRRAVAIWGLGITLAGCQDLPVEPSAMWESEPIRAALAPTITCTRRWASGIDGDWDDPGMWTPVGVPVATDAVCIDAAGTYTVLLDDIAVVDELQLGGNNAAATLHLESTAVTPSVNVEETFSIQSGSELSMTNGLLGLTGWLGVFEFYNDGRITLNGSNTVYYVRMINTGLIRMNGGSEFYGADFQNSGTIGVDAPSSIYLTNLFAGATALFRDGRVTGSGELTLRNLSMYGSASWIGGTLEERSAGSSQAIVVAQGLDAIVVDTAGTGRLTVGASFAATTRISGALGLNMHLQLRNEGGLGFQFPDRFTNWGTLEVLTESGDSATELMLSAFDNQGSLDLVGGGEVDIDSDSIVNRSTTTIYGTVQLGSGVFRNTKTVSVTNGTKLEIFSGATFQADSGSIMSGRLNLKKGRVTGTGTVGFLQSYGGRIEPGLPIGRLTTGSVVMDSLTQLTVEVAGTKPRDYDQLSIIGAVTYDGVLRVLHVAPLSTPACGMVIPVATHSWVGTGTFHTLRGDRSGPPAGWRTHYAANAVQLAGHAAVNGVSFNPTSVIVTEGGSTRTYAACLGTRAPTSDVIVNAASALAQLASIPSVVFGLADWKLPRTFTIRALDDVNVEPTMADTIQHTMVSTDPNYTGGTATVLALVKDNDTKSDLEFTLESARDHELLGTDFTLTYRVRNLGPSSSTGSTITSQPLSGLEYVSASGAACSVNGSAVVTCSVAALAAGAYLDIGLTFRGTALGDQTLALALTGQEPDPGLANNTVAYTLTIN
jgi:hypothetical protein